MTSVKPFSFQRVPPWYQFPAGRHQLYAIHNGMLVTVIIRKSGVVIMFNYDDISAYFPYLVRQLRNWHERFIYTNGAGLTAAQQKKFESGVVLMGQLERRQLSSAYGPSGHLSHKHKAGPDDIALCVFTAIPVAVWQHGADTLGHGLRFAHLLRCMAPERGTYDGTPPYLRPMAKLQLNPWYGAELSDVPTNAQLWSQVQYEFLSNGTRDVLAFDPFMPWCVSNPLCMCFEVDDGEELFADDQEDDEL